MINGTAFRIPHNKLVNVVAWDLNNLIAFDKSTGILSHPNKATVSNTSGVSKKVSRNENSLISGSYNHKKEMYTYRSFSNSHESLWLLNRLDSATSGVILGTTCQAVCDSVKSLFKSREVAKCYYALVFGNMAKDLRIPLTVTKSANSGGNAAQTCSVHSAINWQDDMNVIKMDGILRATSRGGTDKDRHSHHRQGTGSRVASTSVRVVEYSPVYDATLLELRPHTGYTHQLRYQCAANGYPIVGDKTYGDFDRNKQFLEQRKQRDAILAARSKGIVAGGQAGHGCGIPVSDATSHYKPAGTKAGNIYKRLFLHSHKIEFDYELPKPQSTSAGRSKAVDVFHFAAESPVPREFFCGDS